MNFQNDQFSEHLYVQHSPDQEVKGVGWAGIYRSPDPDHGGDILHQTPDGIVHRTTCVTPAELDQTWREVEEQVTLADEPDQFDYVIDTNNPGHVIVSRHGTGESYVFNSYRDAIGYLGQRNNVWMVDAHGNFTKWSVDGEG